MGRQSTVAPVIVKLEPDEEHRRFEAAQGLNQQKKALQRKLGGLRSDEATLKGKIDKVREDIRDRLSELESINNQITDVLDGAATGFLPFGAQAVVDGKPKKPEQLKLKPADILHAMYPDLAQQLKGEKLVSVSKALLLQNSDLRHVAVPTGEPNRVLLIPLHPASWVPPTSQAHLPDLTGKTVDYLDAKLLLGTRDESHLVDVELPKTTAKKGDPLAATRGAAVTRARKDLGDVVEKAINEALGSLKDDELADRAFEDDPTFERLQGVVAGLAGFQLDQVGGMSLGQSQEAAKNVEGLDSKAVLRAIRTSLDDTPPPEGKKKGRKSKRAKGGRPKGGE